jgi:hypothetical protein
MASMINVLSLSCVFLPEIRLSKRATKARSSILALVTLRRFAVRDICSMQKELINVHMTLLAPYGAHDRQLSSDGTSVIETPS